MQRQRGREPQWFDQRLDELEGDASAAHHLETRPVAGLLGIDDGIGGGECRAGQVVVGDDHLPACGFRGRHRRHRRNATITGHDQPRTHPRRLAETGLTEVVAIVQPIGDEGVDIGACGPQGAGQQRGRALAIDIVVAVNQNDCPRAHGSHNDLDGGRHPGEAKRIGK